MRKHNEMNENVYNSIKLRMRVLFLILTDICVISIAKFASVFIRFEFSFKEIPIRFFDAFKKEILPAIVLYIIIFALCKLYRSLWRYAGVDECINIFIATFIATVLNILLNKLLGIFMFRSYYIMNFMMIYIGIFAVRFSYRFLRWARDNTSNIAVNKNVKNVMVVGAGDSGAMIIREITQRPDSGMVVRCAIDDDRTKIGTYVRGIKIIGDRYSVKSAADDYAIDEIIVAIPSASPKQLSEILEICSDTGCKLQMLPNLSQIIDNGSVNLSELRAVKVEDLLGRDPINIDLDSIMSYVMNNTVVVTGGGGSIGSELCRQIASHGPKKLIVIDIYENNIYDLQQELKRTCDDVDIEYLVASVRDYDRLLNIFNKYKPDIVYHAAAHKHVPLMEDSPNEAIKNNVFGTYKTARAAAESGVEKFVLISTDKAVNPTNIMGASKRICEMVIQQMDKQYENTDFVAVRFGNVLASNGSVVKLFEKQIAEGGPVTVTHKDIVRYFMTIPEAVSLVLQAGTLAQGGEIFVLDMGEQVKIDDLARNMIKLSGYIPDKEIKIIYTGLRPGEKLYEETLMAEEGLRQTNNKLIHIGKPIDMDYEKFAKQLNELEIACNMNSNKIAHIVSDIVPTYVVSKELEELATQ